MSNRTDRQGSQWEKINYCFYLHFFLFVAAYGMASMYEGGGNEARGVRSTAGRTAYEGVAGAGCCCDGLSAAVVFAACLS